MALPNRIDIIERVSAEHPGLIVRDPHGFTEKAVEALHAEDARFGFNGKRGNARDRSEDCTAYLDDESPLVGSDGRRIWIVDFIAFANSLDARPAWINQTQATIDNRTTGVWVRPRGVGAPAPTPVHPPSPAPQPVPPSTDLSAIKAQLATILEQQGLIIKGQATLSAQQQHLIDNLFQSGGDSPSMLEHMDDVKNIVLSGERGERFR